MLARTSCNGGGSSPSSPAAGSLESALARRLLDLAATEERLEVTEERRRLRASISETRPACGRPACGARPACGRPACGARPACGEPACGDRRACGEPVDPLEVARALLACTFVLLRPALVETNTLLPALPLLCSLLPALPLLCSRPSCGGGCPFNPKPSPSEGLVPLGRPGGGGNLFVRGLGLTHAGLSVGRLLFSFGSSPMVCSQKCGVEWIIVGFEAGMAA